MSGGHGNGTYDHRVIHFVDQVGRGQRGLPVGWWVAMFVQPGPLDRFCYVRLVYNRSNTSGDVKELCGSCGGNLVLSLARRGQDQVPPRRNTELATAQAKLLAQLYRAPISSIDVRFKGMRFENHMTISGRGRRAVWSKLWW